MNASLTSKMESMTEENARIRRMYAEASMPNDLLGKFTVLHAKP